MSSELGEATVSKFRNAVSGSRGHCLGDFGSRGSRACSDSLRLRLQAGNAIYQAMMSPPSAEPGAASHAGEPMIGIRRRSVREQSLAQDCLPR